MPTPRLLLQTTYAELLDRCAADAFADAFAENGVFLSKTIQGRQYWYFQVPSDQGRTQRYVGPETPELIERISRHKEARQDERERRALVSTLIRSLSLPRPSPEIGIIVTALARAGIFRLRGVLVGTVAYQTYSAMLSAKLPGSIMQTGDVDIAQYRNVSLAVGDQTPPMIDVLKQADKSFRPVPALGAGHSTSYIAKGGWRVDFLTPNKGLETETPQRLPAFQTDAQPLRFLDFLIHDPLPAVVLHQPGICVLVPAPERYAVHKLIVSRRRHGAAAKRDKDIRQAGALFEILAQTRAQELNLVWHEAVNRGRKWKQLLEEGAAQLLARSRDIVLKAVDECRAVIPTLDLTFSNPPPAYDFRRDIVAFAGEALGAKVQCAISREALDDHFPVQDQTKNSRLEQFLKNRSEIERLARAKYLFLPIDEPESVLVKSEDVQSLSKAHFRALRPRVSGRP